MRERSTDVSETGLPAESRIAAGVLPSVGVPIATNAPTPGLAFAAGRIPTAPTLPDADPSTLGILISRLANELFQVPPNVATKAPEAAALNTPSPSASPVLHGADLPSNTVPLETNLLKLQLAGSLPVSTSERSMPRSDEPRELAAADASPNGIRESSSQIGERDVSPFHVPLHFAAWPGNEHGNVMSFPLFDLDKTSRSPFQIDKAKSTDTAFDPHLIRRQFPILQERVHGKRLVWLDNAATTQKPQAVIARLTYFYEHENSNIHRAAHTLAARATEAYENARESVRRFLNAPSVDNIVFVRGATEGINLVAQSWGRANVQAGDEIIVTVLEHHANIVPWQQLCAEKGARLRVAPVDDTGQILLAEYAKLFNAKTRLVAMTQVSNALGTITPAYEMIAIAHSHGVRVLLDGAQAVSHKRVDVQTLDADFYVLSGHKVFAPTGIGAVYAKRELLDAMPPWQGGGNMIQDVTFEKTVYHGPPARFEAGTGNIADAVGLGKALDWLTEVGIDNVESYEHGLLMYGTERLMTVRGLTLIGTAFEKAGVLSFVLAGQETTQVGGMLDKDGIAVRSGHHCAQPILRRFGVEATVRASLAPYNTCEDIDALVEALHRIQSSRVR